MALFTPTVWFLLIKAAQCAIHPSRATFGKVGSIMKRLRCRTAAHDPNPTLRGGKGYTGGWRTAVMARTYLVFGDIEGKLDVLRVECTKCERKGRYSVARLNLNGSSPGSAGEAAKFDISGGRHRRSIDETRNCEP